MSETKKRESNGWRRDIPKDARTLDRLGVRRLPSTLDEGDDETSPKATPVVGVPGATILHNVINQDEVQRFVSGAEALGFDNAHHPDYQNAKIDSLEEDYRQNDRCVYRASPEEVALLYRRIAPLLPQKIHFRGLGQWRLCGLNDMWRFYKYLPAESEEAALAGQGQHFPVHFDNATLKTQDLISTQTILFYLSEGFGGGHTGFHMGSQSVHMGSQPDKPHVTVNPLAGQGLAFYHLGQLSPAHSGMRLWKLPGGSSAKYVLRTDAMYERIGTDGWGRLPHLSPPYDVKPFIGFDEDMRLATGTLVRRCGNPKCARPEPAVTLHQCPGCHETLFCSAECQQAHWKHHGLACAQHPKAKLIQEERVPAETSCPVGEERCQDE